MEKLIGKSHKNQAHLPQKVIAYLKKYWGKQVSQKI